MAAAVTKATAVSGLSCYCSAAAAATDSADANSKTFPGALKKPPAKKNASGSQFQKRSLFIYFPLF